MHGHFASFSLPPYFLLEECLAAKLEARVDRFESRGGGGSPWVPFRVTRKAGQSLLCGAAR